MAKVEDEIYQPGSLGGAPMAQKMDRVCNGFVTFEEFMPSIGDGMMDTGDLIPKIQAMSRK